MYKTERVEELLLEKFIVSMCFWKSIGYEVEEIHTNHQSGFMSFVATFKKYVEEQCGTD